MGVIRRNSPPHGRVITSPHMAFSPDLETARLRLRPQRGSDIAFLVELWSDPEVTRYLGGPRDRRELQRTFEEIALDPRAQTYDLWPIEERETGELVGII